MRKQKLTAMTRDSTLLFTMLQKGTPQMQLICCAKGQFVVVYIPHQLVTKLQCCINSTPTNTTIYQCNLIFFFRGANISAEDSNYFTPVLTAAACKQEEVFHCLMQNVDLSCITANPAFKILAIPSYDSEILKVRPLTMYLQVLKVRLDNVFAG